MDCGLLKSFLLPRTVVPAVCNMGESALPTVQMLSEIVREVQRGGEVDRVTPGNKDGKAQEHDQGIRGGKWVVELRESVKGQLTRSAWWSIGDDDFSLC